MRGQVAASPSSISQWAAVEALTGAATSGEVALGAVAQGELAQEVVQAFGGKEHRHQFIEPGRIFGQGDGGGETDVARAREAVEFWVQECQ